MYQPKMMRFSVCRELGHEPDFKRPTYLADDATPIMPVLKYVTNKFLKNQEAFDEVWLVMACSPLLESTDFINAATTYDKHVRELK